MVCLVSKECVKLLLPLLRELFALFLCHFTRALISFDFVRNTRAIAHEVTT